MYYQVLAARSRDQSQPWHRAAAFTVIDPQLAWIMETQKYWTNCKLYDRISFSHVPESDMLFR